MNGIQYEAFHLCLNEIVLHNMSFPMYKIMNIKKLAHDFVCQFFLWGYFYRVASSTRMLYYGVLSRTNNSQ